MRGREYGPRGSGCHFRRRTTSTIYTATATATDPNSKDTQAPTVTGITLKNPTGSTQGTADAGDILTIQYSEALDASKLCSIRSISGTQTLNANNDVTVTFNHSSTSNLLTVSSKACALTIGTISLGANANYASTTTPVVLVGVNGSVSTVSWNPASSSLTIKLGAPKTTPGPKEPMLRQIPPRIFQPRGSLTWPGTHSE